MLGSFTAQMGHHDRQKGQGDGQRPFCPRARFERRVLYVFHAVMAVMAIVAVARGDWRLLGICLGVFFLNGLIGGGLHMNRHKSFSQLAAGSAGEAEVVSEKADSTDLLYGRTKRDKI